MQPTRMHTLFNRPNTNGVFVIADLGLTNGGQITRALELGDIAADLGVDAVKFQMLDSAELLGDQSVEYTYPTLLKGPITENMYEMFLKLQFTDEEWRSIKERCDKDKLGLIITSHVQSAVDRLNLLDLPVNKICTWSLNHYDMIAALAKNGKPLIIDTGTINQDDLNELSAFYKSEGGSEIIVLYDFHTNVVPEMNFLAIQALKEAGFEVGYTPQGRRDWLDYMSIGLGATVIEKRLTIGRTIPNNGHWKAHEPSEFKEWLENIRECATSLGEKQLKPTTADTEGTKKWYKSALLKDDASAGDIIRPDMFVYKRPGTGVSSREMRKSYIGKPLKHDYKAGEEFKG